MPRLLLIPALVCAATFGTSAHAANTKVTAKSEFVALIAGKTLKRPLIELEVLPDGRIAGTGARWAVSGNWTWNNGYFCRDLNWGGSDLGYNCQEVRVVDGRIRFTSDKGTGDSADFRLR